MQVHENQKYQNMEEASFGDFMKSAEHDCLEGVWAFSVC